MFADLEIIGRVAKSLELLFAGFRGLGFGFAAVDADQLVVGLAVAATARVARAGTLSPR